VRWRGKKWRKERKLTFVFKGIAKGLTGIPLPIPLALASGFGLLLLLSLLLLMLLLLVRFELLDGFEGSKD